MAQPEGQLWQTDASLVCPTRTSVGENLENRENKTEKGSAFFSHTCLPNRNFPDPCGYRVNNNNEG
ncbi:MAG: hypothetical protein CM1200mP3_18370 [Chloroflexota bacterium]|nr:MAG: hypothetical protein CM1200mP3_18370 [Chloroflexota bacterium]